MSDELTIDIGATFGAHLKAALDDSQERDWEHEREREKLIPLDIPFQGSATIAAGATSCVIECGGPSLGRAWVLRRLSVSLSDPTATAAGAAYLFASSTAAVAQLLAQSWIGVISSLPAVSFYSTRQIVLGSPLRIVVKITGGTAGDTYVVSGLALEEVAHEPAAARWTL